MKQVGIAEFKAHLSKYLRDAKAGEEIRITDRGVPVARLSPHTKNGLRIQPAKGSLRDFKALPPPSNLKFDVVADLLRDRERR